MSDSIIIYLLNIIKLLCEIIVDLSSQLEKFLAHRKTPVLTSPVHLDYQCLTVDELPKNLALIIDGNPIYKLAQAYFAQHEKDFEVIQVVGLTNEDSVSKNYRPLKQIIERLNRTFKGNYKPLGGYGAQSESIAYLELLRLTSIF